MCHKPKGKRGGAGKMAHTRNWSMKLRGGGQNPSIVLFCSKF